MSMVFEDVMRFGWRAITGYRSRSILMLCAMAIGVAAVLILTAIGNGARQYVTGEFASLGTNMVIVIPGRSETSGANPAMMVSATPRDLTLDDARILYRNNNIRRIAPINLGTAEASWQGRKRESLILGTTHEMLALRHWQLARGQFLPEMDWQRGSPVCVIGTKIRDELFGVQSALGKWLRLGDRRYRVIGVMASEGRSIGVDVENTVIIPVASAQSLFNVPSLVRILIEVKQREQIPQVIDYVERTLQLRHQGERDVTVITQDAVLQTFDKILGSLTYALSGIAAISLLVAGILIMNVMLVAVSQRTAEIGLLKALGASAKNVLLLILSEALLLTLLGAVAGILIGQLASWLIRVAWPQIAAYPPLWAMLVALAVALLTGAVFSILPARNAARLDPITALMKH